jgi:hypothetical protein
VHDAEEGNAPPPLFLAARGAPEFLAPCHGVFLLPLTASEGVERRVAPMKSALGGAGALGEGRAPRGAPLAAILSPRHCASELRRGPHGPPIRAASAALRRRRVQPLKAAGRNASGRFSRGLPNVRLRTSPAGAAQAAPGEPGSARTEAVPHLRHRLFGPLLHFRIASRSAPRRASDGTISAFIYLTKVMGFAIFGS